MNRISSDSNEFLLAQIRQGCRKSFDLLYNKYWDRAYSDAFRALKDEDQAKDLVQEIFIKIWHSNSIINDIESYLKVAVRNQVFRLIAEEKRKSPFLDLLYDLPGSPEADVTVKRKEFYKKYEHFISSLPPKRQRIFRLRFTEDQSTKVIAQRMGITRKTVQNQLGKAIEHLKVMLLH